MAKITSEVKKRFQHVGQKIYNLTMRQLGVEYKLTGGVRSFSSIAKDMAKVSATIQEAYAEDMISKETLVQWLMNLDPTPMELSEIIEEIEENKKLMFCIVTLKYETGA